MNRYHGLTLGRKILAGFLLVACIAGLSGIFATGGIWDVSRRGEQMYTGNLVPISDLTEVVKGYQTSLCLLRDIVIDKSSQEQNEHLEKLKQSEGRVAKGLASFFAANRSREAAALQKSIGEDLKLYEYFREKVVELATTERRDEAINIMRTQASDVTDRIDESITKVVALNKAQAHQRYTDNAAAARFALAISALCLSLGVAAALFIGYFLSRSITAPLAMIAGKVADIAGGDLTARIGCAAAQSSRNELHVLSRNVDQMADKLHRVVARIASESRDLSASSSNLSSSSETMAQMTELASGEIHTVASSSAEMNQTASEIARNCTTAADNVSRANDAVSQGRRITGETIASMRAIGDHARNTSKVIAQLGERSLQIGEITETINDIADQTNLLALNAAIEAARAGDHGRGFAVVADEVRALASRTTTATKEIAAMIKSIQGETRLAIAAMDKGVSEAETGVGKAESTGEALETITSTIRSISEEVSHIATAAEEQSSTVHGITGNIQKVTRIINDSAAGTQEFAAAASGLHLLAVELKEIVSGFTIEETPPASAGSSFREEPPESAYLDQLTFAAA
jgi:methyl-accepting chemotaxis protein